MTFQKKDRDQQIHQFLGVITPPTKYCFKIWKERGNKIRSDPKQARLAGSTNTIVTQDFSTSNNIRLLLLSDKQPNTGSIISRHTSPRLWWQKQSKVISSGLSRSKAS